MTLKEEERDEFRGWHEIACDPASYTLREVRHVGPCRPRIRSAFTAAMYAVKSAIRLPLQRLRQELRLFCVCLSVKESWGLAWKECVMEIFEFG